VDPVSGYRLYEPGQLDRARLVAWLRRLGMPLARIRVVCDLAPEEALSHPERALLLRALDGTQAAVPDLSLHDVRPGDRYLLCSDGLTTVVPSGGVHQVLRNAAEPAAAVRELIGLANSGGGPDNIACVVADIMEATGLAAAPAASPA
jgi:serine/threonine protein phosphatase PrpC